MQQWLLAVNVNTYQVGIFSFFTVKVLKNRCLKNKSYTLCIANILFPVLLLFKKNTKKTKI